MMTITMTVGMMPAVALAADANVAGTSESGNVDWGNSSLAMFMDNPADVELGEDDYANPYGHKPGRNFMMLEQNELMVLNGSDYFNKDKIVSMFDNVDFDKHEHIYDTSDKLKDFELADKVTELNFTQTVSFDPTGSGRRDHMAIVGVDSSSQTWLYVYSTVNDKWSNGCQLNDMWWVDNGSDFYCMQNFISITAGDYDDDGKDSLVVYIAGEPNEGGKHDGYGLAEIKVTKSDSEGITIPEKVLDKEKILLNPEYVANYEKIRDKEKGSSDGKVRLMGVVRTGDIDNDLVDDLVVMSYTRLNSSDFSYKIKVPFLAANLGKTEEEVKAAKSFNITKDVKTITKKDDANYGHPILSDYVEKNTVAPYNSMLTANITVVNTDTEAGDEIIVAGHYVDFSVKDGNKYKEQSRKDKLNIAKYTFKSPDGKNKNSSLDQKYLSCKGKDLNGSSIDLEKSGFSNHWKEKDPGHPQISCQGVYMNGPTNPGYVEIGGDIYDCSSNALDSVIKVYTNDFQKDQDDACDALLISENLVPYAVAGNFDENDFGYEQVVMALVRKEQSADDYVVSYQIVGTKTDSHDEESGVIPLAKLSEAFYEKETIYELYNKGDNLTDVLSCNIVAVDADDDGILARYNSTEDRRKCFYTDPQVEAILQSTPYFGDLRRTSACYSSTMNKIKTEYKICDYVGKGEGMSATVSMEKGNTKTKQKFGKFFNKNKQRSFGEGHSETTQFSTTYIHGEPQTVETTAGDDAVLVTRTPEVFYAYDLYVPGENGAKGEWDNGAYIITTSLPKIFETFSVDAYNYFVEKYNSYMRDSIANGSITNTDFVPMTKIDSEACYLGIAPDPSKYLSQDNINAQKAVGCSILSTKQAIMPHDKGANSTGTSDLQHRMDVRSTAQKQTLNYSKSRGLIGRNTMRGSYTTAASELSNSETRIAGSEVDISIYVAGIDTSEKILGFGVDYLLDYTLKCQLAQWNSNIPAPTPNADIMSDEDEKFMEYVPVYGSVVKYTKPGNEEEQTPPPNGINLDWVKKANPDVADQMLLMADNKDESVNVDDFDSEVLKVSWNCDDSELIDKYGIYMAVADPSDTNKASYDLIDTVPASTNEYTFVPEEDVPILDIRVCAMDKDGQQISPMSAPAMAFSGRFFDKLRTLHVKEVGKGENAHYELYITENGLDKPVKIKNAGVKSIVKTAVNEETGTTEYTINFADKESKTISIKKQRDFGIKSITRVGGGSIADKIEIELENGKTYYYELPIKPHSIVRVDETKPGKWDGYSGDLVCEECGKIFAVGKVLPALKAKLSSAKFTYNGKTHKPSVVANNNLKLNKDYTVKWSGNGKNVGTYTAKVHFKDADFDQTLSFDVVPAKTTLSSVKGGSKSFTVKWDKQTKKMSDSRITGYQVQYATNSKFTKNENTVTVKGYKNTSKKIKGVNAKKKYYVRVRTYKTVGGTNYYSGWSKAQNVKTN